MKKHKILFTVLALITTTVLVAGVCAEATFSAIWNAGTRLAFNTDNAVITANAAFSYEGEVFKKFSASYTKDGFDNLMSLDVFTPRGDGTEKETGYKVLGRDGEVWSWDKGDETSYYGGIDPSQSIIRNSGMRNMLTLAGDVVTAAADILAADKITVTNAENGNTDYRITLKPGDVPQVLNNTLYTLISGAADRYGYGTVGLYGRDDQFYTSYSYDDFDASFALCYQEVFGEPLPDDFWENLYNVDSPMPRENGEGDEEEVDVVFNEETWTRWEAVIARMDEMEAEILVENPGVAVINIHPDNSYTCYRENAEFIIASGQQYVIYEDMAVTFAQYYKQVTGEELDPQAYEAGISFYNPELYEAVWEMINEMDHTYIADCVEHEGAICVMVMKNGEKRYITNEDDLFIYNSGDTLIRTMLMWMSGISVDSVDADVQLNSNGDLVSAAGTVELGVMMTSDTPHRLTVTFDIQVEYGTADLSDTTYEVLGVPLWEDWFRQNYGGDYDKLWEDLYGDYDPSADAPSFPESVTFMGVEYPITDLDPYGFDSFDWYE